MKIQLRDGHVLKQLLFSRWQGFLWPALYYTDLFHVHVNRLCLRVYAQLCIHPAAFHLSILARLINILCTLQYVYVTYYAHHVFKEFHHLALFSKYLVKRSSQILCSWQNTKQYSSTYLSSVQINTGCCGFIHLVSIHIF